MRALTAEPIDHGHPVNVSPQAMTPTISGYPEVSARAMPIGTAATPQLDTALVSAAALSSTRAAGFSCAQRRGDQHLSWTATDAPPDAMDVPGLVQPTGGFHVAADWECKSKAVALRRPSPSGRPVSADRVLTNGCARSQDLARACQLTA
jgi:hypothetical protein